MGNEVEEFISHALTAINQLQRELTIAESEIHALRRTVTTSSAIIARLEALLQVHEENHRGRV